MLLNPHFKETVRISRDISVSRTLEGLDVRTNGGLPLFDNPKTKRTHLVYLMRLLRKPIRSAKYRG